MDDIQVLETRLLKKFLGTSKHIIMAHNIIMLAGVIKNGNNWYVYNKYRSQVSQDKVNEENIWPM
jgi:hypothetical protein